jgi:hypothetical protein
MIFKPMPPEEVRKALAGHTDALTPAINETDAFFKALSCPSCGGECMKFVDPHRLWREGAILPNFLARCKACGVEFEPYTGIQVTIAHPNKVTF